jgi:hypothetical protein
VELHLHSLNTPSWRGVQLKHRDDFTFIFYIPAALSLGVGPVRYATSHITNTFVTLNCNEYSLQTLFLVITQLYFHFGETVPFFRVSSAVFLQ